VKRVGRILALFVTAALLLAGCSTPSRTPGAGATAPTSVSSAFPVTVTDDLGRAVTIDKQPERLVSLAPADTEILAGLGLMAKVVGVTTYDDYPAEVKSIAKVGDFTTPNLEAIASLKPDVVFVTGGIQMDVVKKLEGLGAKVVVVDPPSMEKLYGSIAMVGAVTGASTKAALVVTGMKAEVTRITAAISTEPSVTCFVEVAQNPLYTTGPNTLLADLMRIAGGRNVVTEPGYVAYSLERLLKDDPSVYLATKGSMNDPGQLAKRPGFSKLSALKTGSVHVLDDNLVSRPGPRVVSGLAEIAAYLHPAAASRIGTVAP
jgi:iron complex transport system substrate-binding protein